MWREKPCKKNDQKQQKTEVKPSLNWREREKTQKTFEKMFLKKSKSVFKKPDSQYSIDQKTVSINRKSGKMFF